MTTETVRRKDNVVRVEARSGYNKCVGLLCRLKDTGNGYIAKFPSYSSHTQDHYLCMEYDEAAYLYAALGAMLEKKHDRP